MQDAEKNRNPYLGSGRNVPQWESGKPYIYWTDWESPAADTDKGHILSQHADLLMEKHCTFNKTPRQGVDILDPPKDLLDLPCAVHVLGSPAPFTPDGQRSRPDLTPMTMKINAFYSMMWHSPTTAAIIMTYSANACRVENCPRMDFWMSPVKAAGMDLRNLWVGFAHFESYKPSAGFYDDFHLSEAAIDTMVAIYAPPSYVHKFVFASSQLLDLRLTIRAWLENCGAFPVVTYSAWTGELEVDLAC